jgi:predicted HTH domain antitoxin
MADLPIDEAERQIQFAIEAIRSKAVSSIRKAAELFEVPRSTLQDRLSGKRQPNKQSKQGMQRLTIEEEDSIVKAALQLYAWG